MISTWSANLPDGKTSEELLLSFDQSRPQRVLVLPAWFDEANKLRRFTVQTMRALDEAGVDSFLPDLPGCNESLASLSNQTIASWKTLALDAARQFEATHFLTVRGGALIAPETLPGWQYAPLSGPKLLRAMIRARTIAAREAGREETSEALFKRGRSDGLTLAGWSLGAMMFAQLEKAEPVQSQLHSTIKAKDLGRAGLWLRAEPGEDAGQASALAGIISGKAEQSS